MLDLIALANKDLEYAQKMSEVKLGSGLASSFADTMASVTDYNILTANAGNLMTQAGEIELQAKEQANQIRQQYLSAVANYEFMAAQRGVDVKSGSVVSNIRGSAENLGEDISKMQENAAWKAKQMRTQAKIEKSRAKNEMIGGVLGGISKASMSLANYDLEQELIKGLKK